MIEAAPRLPRCLLWAADIGAWAVTGAVSRIYAQLRPLRNVRALYRRRGSRRCRAPQNSVKSAAARDAPPEGCGGGADECLDW